MSSTDTSVSLEERVALLQAELDKRNKSGVKSALKKFGASVLAALTTPDAIKVEKSLAVVALTRAVILVPSAALLIDLLVKALGGPAVSP